ncbi:MAG: glycoside hydrolase family 3 protein [Deltaproteobacteria bacterium]|nr:glycoside hydrolase family 3 protein [Deltaproteobacteria bacterium]
MIQTDLPAVGHLFMAGLPGPELDDSTLALIKQHAVHNFIIFRRNVVDRRQMTRLCASLVDACQAHSLPRPLISIDQEGGKVARLPPPFSQFPEPRSLAEGGNPERLLREYAAVCARELRQIGVNMNLAPVLDICPAGRGMFMERRCLGSVPQRVAELGRVVINGLQAGGVAACAKHFPGLGAAVLDPHLELPVVELAAGHFEREALTPFRMAAKIGVAAFMTSHAVYSNFAPRIPGTLSRKVVSDLVRGNCGYDGLIITDDLEMGAIEKFMPFPEAALQALLAGADLLLICQRHDKVRNAIAALEAALRDRIFAAKRIDDSLARQAEVIRRFS